MNKLKMKYNISFTDEIELTEEEYPDYMKIFTENKEKLIENLKRDVSELIIEEVKENGKIISFDAEIDIS